MSHARFKIRRPSNRGLTLIELLVAALILAVGITTLMNAWIFAFGMTRRSDEVEVGYNLARAAGERLRSQGYFFADPATIPEWYDANQQTTDSASAYYRVQATLRPGSDIGGAATYLNLKQIDITVSRAADGSAICHLASYLAVGGV